MPKVSRKIRACTECQKQKVKCNTDSGSSSCSRCLRYGLNCVYYRSIQTILEEETQWKTNFQTDLTRLERIVDQSLKHLKLPDTSDYDESGNLFPSSQIDQAEFDHPRQQAPSVTATIPYCSPIAVNPQQQRYRSEEEVCQNVAFQPDRPQQLSPVYSRGQEEDLNERGNIEKDELMTEPMGSLFEVTRLNKFRSRPQQGSVTSPKDHAMMDDFIARGVISMQEAEELLELFTKSLNHYLWVGLDDRHSTVDQIRKSSPLLTASIMTAMSMHVPNRTETHDKCYAEFLSLVSQSMFSHTHNLDDIRGLTIAAFWLSDLSWKLSGHAVRIATELELHRSYPKAFDSAEHHEHARIWYMLYVCDHHFANAYGRPPMVYETQQMIEHEQFLQSPWSTALDYRLLSQVALFMILRRIHDDFDGRASSPFSSEMATKMRQHNLALDQWRLLWEPRQEPNPFIGTFPSQGNVLYYNFAKLQLNVLSLHRSPFDLRTGEFTTLAIGAASNIIMLILEDSSLRRALVGTPLYVHTMVTFACVFLFKAATSWRAMVRGGEAEAANATIVMLDAESMCALVLRVVHVLNSAKAGERHLIYRIANGLEKMVRGYQAFEEQERENHTRYENAAVGSNQVQDSAAAWSGEAAGAGGRQMYNWGDSLETFDEFGVGFGLGINQFLNTHIQF